MNLVAMVGGVAAGSALNPMLFPFALGAGVVAPRWFWGVGAAGLIAVLLTGYTILRPSFAHTTDEWMLLFAGRFVAATLLALAGFGMRKLVPRKASE